MAAPEKPTHRAEAYLNGILGKLTGDSSAEIPEKPTSRLEAYLEAIFYAVGSGGGSSYVLPVATRQRLGGVKAGGDGVSIASDGTISSFGAIGTGISVTADVGGYKNGDWIPAKTQIPVILHKLLSPSEKPVLTPPSVTMEAEYGLPQYAEAGQSVYVGNITVSFDRGKIEPAYGTDGYRAGIAQSYTLKVGDEPEQTNGNGIFGVGGILRATKGTVPLVASVWHAAGPQPKDSQGADYDSALPANTITITKNIEFIQAFYYGATDGGDVTSFAGLTRDLTGKGTKTYYVNADNQYPTFIYDADYGELESLKEQNGFEAINGFEKSVITVGGNRYIMYRQENRITDARARFQLFFTL